MFDLTDFRAVDLGRAAAKMGVVWMDGGVSRESLGELRGEGVRGIRPPAVRVENTRPLMGVQTSTVAIDDCGYDESSKTFFLWMTFVCMQTVVCL